MSTKGSYAYTGGIQYFTAPTAGMYDIVGYGGSGGASASYSQVGQGAEVGGTFTLTANEHLEIVVASAGSSGRYGGGGGGTFVFGDGTGDGTGNGTYGKVLLVAGGGGGAGNDFAPGASAGGDRGNGYGGPTQQFGGGGGAGVKSPGAYSYSGSGGSSGPTFAGGTGYNRGGNGGFGGGGGGSYYGGGGGGGYSGGFGNAGYGNGNPGTSFDGGTPDGSHNFDAANTGNGMVLIDSMPCYCTGTLIRTARGEVAVEALAIGDLVVTASGARRPIKWIGHRGYIGRFANANPDVLPICFKAGSIAEGVPSRDLWVSPKHAMFLDGVLIPAEHLVNGTSVVKAERIDSVEYWHIELDAHDVLVAEGAEAESFVDDLGRGIFHNAHTFRELYPDALEVEASYCAPRVEDGYLLDAVRRRLAERAGLRVAATRRFGELRGHVDGCNGRRVWGWAQDLAYPDAPVCLDVLVDGDVVGMVYADLMRPDLTEGGIGDGSHAFSFVLPRPLSDDAGHTVAVRRSADAASLPGRTTFSLSRAARPDVDRSAMAA